MYDTLSFGSGYLGSLIWLVGLIFWIWMLVHAARNGQWIWFVFMILFWFLTPILYFFLVFLPMRGSTGAKGFELPGAADRKRIAQLKSDIHNLDKAHSYLELGDIYFNQGNLDKAEDAFRAAHERDDDDIDILAHYGQCLLRQGKPKEARPLLEEVMRRDGQHDYGHSMMAFAETLVQLGETKAAAQYYADLNKRHTYARARVGYAELLIAQGDPARARELLQDLVEDEPHRPPFQRRREAPFLRKARTLLRSLPS